MFKVHAGLNHPTAISIIITRPPETLCALSQICGDSQKVLFLSQNVLVLGKFSQFEEKETLEQHQEGSLAFFYKISHLSKSCVFTKHCN